MSADVTGHVLQGALAASVTPLTAGERAARRGAFGPLSDRYVEGGLDGILAFGTNGEGDPLLGRGAPARAAAVRRGRGRALRRRCTLRGADHRRHGGARRGRRRDRRGCGRGDRAAVLPTRRYGSAGAFPAAAHALRAPALLRLRVRAGKRIRRSASTSCGASARPRRTSPASRSATRRGKRSSPTSRSASTCSSAPSRSSTVASKAARLARCPLWRRRSRSRWRLSSASRPGGRGGARRAAGGRRAVPATGGDEADPRRGRRAGAPRRAPPAARPHSRRGAGAGSLARRSVRASPSGPGAGCSIGPRRGGLSGQSVARPILATSSSGPFLPVRSIVPEARSNRSTCPRRRTLARRSPAGNRNRSRSDGRGEGAANAPPVRRPGTRDRVREPGPKLVRAPGDLDRLAARKPSPRRPEREIQSPARDPVGSPTARARG